MVPSINARHWLRPIWAACLLISSAVPARADIFRLEHGGQVEGEWLNHDEQPLTKYVVRTAAGVT